MFFNFFIETTRYFIKIAFVERKIVDYLRCWHRSPRRQPLVLRGARQVGKTWLVREFAKIAGVELVELNFERNPEYARYFKESEPRKIINNLEIIFSRKINLGQTLLFLDEIQAAPELLPVLRWFAEECSELALIAAGSLLEFTLLEHRFSMPVGRISYAHMEPMGFREYLVAHGQEQLLEALNEWSPGASLSAAACDAAAKWFYRYQMVGGMPWIVAADVDGASAQECRRLQRDLIQTFRDDFGKYASRVEPQVMNSVLSAIASSIGRKFVYAHVAEEMRQYYVKQALELMASARLCHFVTHSDANGVPLAGERNIKKRKVILLDVGLAHGLWDTPVGSAFPDSVHLSPRLKSAIDEQVLGQQLRLLVDDPSVEPQLFYWQREGSAPGEIDYLLLLHGQIIPVESKAGKAGAMKSLHQFMHDKGLGLAVRCDANPPSLQNLSIKTTKGQAVHYKLLGIPQFLVWRLPELVGCDC